MLPIVLKNVKKVKLLVELRILIFTKFTTFKYTSYPSTIKVEFLPVSESRVAILSKEIKRTSAP